MKLNLVVDLMCTEDTDMYPWMTAGKEVRIVLAEDERS
jgi:hypothetical protein